jgi:hypothetical protein
MANYQDESKGASYVHEDALSKNDHNQRAQAVTNAVQLAEDVANTRYSPWTKSMFRLYGCLAIAYLCGCLNGYDGSLMGGINAMSTYQHFFHMFVDPPHALAFANSW